MRSEWPLLPLGDMTVNHDSKRVPVKEADRRPGPYPYYGASGVVDAVDRYLFDGEYLLIAEDGENLRKRNMPIAFRAKGKFWVNNHAHIVQGNERARTQYLEYAVLAADIAPYLTGAVMPKLTQGNLNKILLPCPSLCEQDAIVNVLGAFDDRIDNLRATNATLEAIAQALFKSWFVDFDPVHAKAEGRAPEGMDAATAALFPSEFEDSELGPVPKGWRVGVASDLFSIVSGGTPKTSVAEFWNGEIPWFSVVDAPASGQVFVLDTAKKVTAMGLEHCSAKLLPPRSTIISARGTVGKIAMTGVPMVTNQSCYGLRPAVEGSEAFVYFATHHMVGQLQQITHGAVFDTITRASFDQIATAVPSSTAILAFCANVDPLLSAVQTNSERMVTLTDLRDTLLSRLISGKLRLPDADQLENVMA